MIDLRTVKSAQITDLKKANLIYLPKTYLDIDDWNDLLKYLNKLCSEELIKKEFPRTPSGGVSVKNTHLINQSYMVDVKYNKDGTVNTAKCYTFYYDEAVDRILDCCFILARNTSYNLDKTTMTGTAAFETFVKELCKDNIDINDYKITNGIEVKKQIVSPLIKLIEATPDEIYQNVHHLDIHSSYPSAMMEYHPEWSKTINRLYDGRKTHPEYKLVLNATYGYFQSKYCRFKNDGTSYEYALADVSKYCLDRNNEKIYQMTEKLYEAGCKVLAYNTDGIWFQGPSQQEYVGEKRIGHFEQDHTNCTIRFKSAGSYEFIENNNYYPVVRGLTKLDKIKDRSQWQFGDIYAEEAEIARYRISNDNYGIISIL